MLRPLKTKQAEVEHSKYIQIRQLYPIQQLPWILHCIRLLPTLAMISLLLLLL